jgi:hypothetical protein
MFYVNYLLIKTKLNNNGANMSKPIQFKKLLLLMLLLSSSMNVFSQTIRPYIAHQWEEDRYTNHGDGTVTDKKTGLMWKQCSEGLSGSDCSTVVTGATEKYTYKGAIELTEGYSFVTYSDWRLPNLKELVSLAARDRHEPAINSKLFPSTPTSDVFWSSSPYASTGKDALTLNFKYGHDGYSVRTSNRYVRLVRGGP